MTASELRALLGNEIEVVETEPILRVAPTMAVRGPMYFSDNDSIVVHLRTGHHALRGLGPVYQWTDLGHTNMHIEILNYNAEMPFSRNAIAAGLEYRKGELILPTTAERLAQDYFAFLQSLVEGLAILEAR